MARWCAILLLTASTAQAFSLRKDAAGDVIRWRGPVHFVLDEASVARWNVPGARDAIHAAVDTFAQVMDPTVPVSLRDGRARRVGVDLEDPSRNQNDIIVLFDWPYTDGALATTLVTYDAKKDQIVDADVLINAEQHTFGVLDLARPQALHDVQTAVTHELGHALGLMHNDVDEAVVMYPRVPAGELRKRQLADDDRAGLAALYSSPEQASQGLETDALVVAQGCSSSSNLGLLALLIVVSAALRRRPQPKLVPVRRRSSRAHVSALLVIGSAGASQAQDAPDAVRVTVKKAQSSLRGGLITTTLSLELDGCATCPPATIVVPGGRVGDLIQEVVDHPVPALHDRLVLVRRGDALKLQRLPRQTSDTRAAPAGPVDPRGASGTRAPAVQPLTSPTPVPGSAIEMENAHGPATATHPDRR